MLWLMPFRVLLTCEIEHFSLGEKCSIFKGGGVTTLRLCGSLSLSLSAVMLGCDVLQVCSEGADWAGRIRGRLPTGPAASLLATASQTSSCTPLVQHFIKLFFCTSPFMMIVLLVVAMLTACAAVTEDLSGRMFTFPQETNTAHVKLNVAQQELSDVTVCHRSFTDLKRDHSLFSLATSSNHNDFLIFWTEATKEMQPVIRDKQVDYRGFDYKPNTWHSICTTWDSKSGLVQMWFDGIPSIRKFISSGSNIKGAMIITLGQDQDSHGGAFDIKQSFVGMMSDVHMWDHILSSCEIQKYVDGNHFTPGNVINWNALDFQIVNNVLIEDKWKSCY